MSNRVQGARLKAAAAAHARKQLSALGANVTAKRGQASFKGSNAYAYWSLCGDDVVSYGINYPALPDNALISRREADLIAAYTLHEIGHVAYTNNSVTKGVKRLVFHLWNGIEDARIEHAVIASGKAAGARSAFKRLMSKYTSQLPDEFNPTSINSAPFALALICRAALGDGNGFAKTLLDRIPEPKRSLYATVVDAMPGLALDRTGTFEALKLAEAFLDGWLALEPDAVKKPVDVLPPPGGVDNPDEQAADEYDLEPDGEAQPDEYDDVDDQYSEPQGSGEGGDEGFDWDDDPADGDAADGEDGADADAISDAIKDALDAEPADAGDSTLLDQSEDDVEEEVSGGSGEGAQFDDVLDEFHENKVMQPEPNVDDIFQQIMERTKAPIDLPPVLHANRTLIRDWRTVVEQDESGQRRHYRALHKAALPALKAQLYRILKAPERCGWDGGALGGRFDGKRTSRMMAGSELVFKRRWVSDGINTAVSVVIDMSGSMKGDRIKQSVALGWTIAEAAEAAGAEVEVVGFSSRYAFYPDSGTGLDGEWKSPDLGAEARHPACLIVAKRWQDKCANVAQFFNVMKRAAEGGTPDYSAVRTVAEQLSTHTAGRKLVIVITDGCGQIHEMKALTKSAYDLYGVDVIGFGIGIDSKTFANAYHLGATVDWQLRDLHKTCLKSVADQLAARDHRRVA